VKDLYIQHFLDEVYQVLKSGIQHKTKEFIFKEETYLSKNV
jgi:hypothetical protein